MPENEDEKKLSKKKLFRRRMIFICVAFIATVLIVNLALFMIGVRSGKVERWSRDQYAGRIVDLTADGFVIKMERHMGTRTIHMDEYTMIRDGRREVGKEDLTPGRYVVVFGTPLASTSAVVSRNVRVFGSKGSTSPQSF